MNQGAIIEVMGSGILPRLWGKNKDKVSLDIQDARLGYVDYPNNQPVQQEQQPQQAPAGFDDFDDDIPF